MADFAVCVQNLCWQVARADFPVSVDAPCPSVADQGGDIAALIGYTWAGGIDGDWEIGARNLPAEVLDTYRKIGHAITGK